MGFGWFWLVSYWFEGVSGGFGAVWGEFGHWFVACSGVAVSESETGTVRLTVDLRM